MSVCNTHIGFYAGELERAEKADRRPRLLPAGAHLSTSASASLLPLPPHAVFGVLEHDALGQQFFAHCVAGLEVLCLARFGVLAYQRLHLRIAERRALGKFQ